MVLRSANQTTSTIDAAHSDSLASVNGINDQNINVTADLATNSAPSVGAEEERGAYMATNPYAHCS